MAAEAAGDDAVAGPNPNTNTTLTFTSLPVESQREILSHCSHGDLICIALVSKHFHELASSVLYRDFHIIFPDDDDINFDSPIDGLAGGLDTFTTSEYNYAKHLKDMYMDTLSPGIKGEHSYQSYLYRASCGKFLNTLLYLTLRKARSLESFRWNIRVELSRPVYQELHRIQSLKRLHIRMQAGESYYNAPPPLPASIDVHPIGPTNHWPQIMPPSPGPLPPVSPPLFSIAPNSVPIGPPPPIHPLAKPPPKSKASKRGPASKEPSTFSGFKNLKSLSVLDIDNLDIVSELKTCIGNSSSTLTDLQLSFSDGLATQARKPSFDSDPEDSDVEDEFQVMPSSSNYENSGPAKAFRAQEERNFQEAVLGKILDVEPLLVKKPQMQQTSEKRGESSEMEKEREEDSDSSKNPRDQFMSSIRGVSNRLMAILHGSGNFSASQADILDTIAQAARKYVDAPAAVSGETQAAGSGGTENKHIAVPQPGSSSEQTAAIESVETMSAQNQTISGNIQSPEVADEPTSSSFESKDSKEPDATPRLSKKKGIAGEVQPEDIDIEHLETVEDASDDDDQQPAENEVKTTQDMDTPTQSGVSESPLSSDMTPASSTASSSAAGKAVDNSSTEATETTETTETPVATSSQPPEHTRASIANLSSEIETVADASTAYLIDTLVATFELQGSLTNLQDKADGQVLGPTEFQQAEEQAKALGKSLSSLRQRTVAAKEQLKIAKAVEKDLGQQLAKSDKRDKQTMKDYIRDTRGFSLESLSIHLVPVKASVLSRAINLSCLKQLTLLNVGNQTAIWTLLTKENKENPLALRSVFTDNVSTSFLTCMSGLTELHDLLLLERSVKTKPESFAPRGSTTIDQIRRLVLKKHMPTLKRLMIKDESNGPNWDVNEKAMILICNRGLKLEELAVSLNIHAVHAFMQYFSSMISLRAIHILHFKNTDTCIWVMREILKFIVDNLSHNPDLKLEWIAMEDERVDRVVRPTDVVDGETEEQTKKSGGKNKMSAPSVLPTVGFSNSSPTLPVDGLDSESESETEDFDSGTRLRFKTVGPLQFYDVCDVKIFEKEVRSGRL